MIIMRSKTLTSQKCKLCYQCFFRKIGDNYARDDKLCQHNLSKPKRRSATRSELCLRLTFSDVPSPGRTSKADMWIVSYCSLSRFVWIFLVQKWAVAKHRSVDEATYSGLRSVFQITFTVSFTLRSHVFGYFLKQRVFSPFSSSSFFFSKRKKRLKKPLTRYVAYLNRFRRLHKNGKTTEIHCMIASLTEHA